MIRLFKGCLLLSFFLCALAVPDARAGTFRVRCAYDHSAMDDPIMFPGRPGASHMHDFFGSLDTNALSRLRSMRNAGTSCTLEGDTAGYWAPAVYRNGVKIDPEGQGPTGVDVRTLIYYSNNLDPSYNLEVPRPDLRIIAGNGHAMSYSENPALGKEIYWGCSDNSNDELKPKTPPASCPTGIIALHIGFPNCWDGKLTHDNDTSHLVYPKRGGICPAPFTHALPRVVMRLEYPVGLKTGTITLASGPLYTAHGDFWNTWNGRALTNVIRGCVRDGVGCGTF